MFCDVIHTLEVSESSKKRTIPHICHILQNIYKIKMQINFITFAFLVKNFVDVVHIVTLQF